MSVFDDWQGSVTKPYRVAFSEEARAAAEASSSLAEVEAEARTEIGKHLLWEDALGRAVDLPPWGFHSFQMPDGQRFIALFFGQNLAEIELVGSESSADRGR
jgi:hypothetical protein